MAEHPGASSQPAPTPSTESRKEDVVPTLRDLSLLPVPNWYLLGLQLGVNEDELDKIETNYPRDNDLCKVKMFGAWLRADTRATYGKLARALVTLGKRSIAEAMCTARGIPLTVLDDNPLIRMDYLPPTPTLNKDSPEFMTRYTREGSQILESSSVSNLATVVSAATTQTTKKTPFRNKKDSCASKPSEDVFTSESANASPGSSSTTQSEENPLETGSPPPTFTTTSFPYLKKSGLTLEEQQRLSVRLCVESEDIIHKFWHLHSTIYESLRQRNIPVERLIVHLLSLGAFDPVSKDSQKCQKPVFQTFSEELQTAGTIENVLLVIEDYFSFFNYHVLEHIVNKLGTDKDKIELQKYKKEFDEYAKHRIYECPPVYGSMSKANHAVLLMKLDSVYEKFTVKELKKFEYRLSRIFCVSPQSVLRLCRVEEGCLQLIFQVPTFVQQEIFPLSSEQESALAAAGVIRLTCGNYQFAKGDEDGSEPEDTVAITHQAITAKFTDLKTKVCNKLSKKRVSIRQFRLFVKKQFPPGDFIPPPPASFTEIFEAITYHGLWDFLHYSPLVHIIHKFGGNDPEMEGWVQNYRKDLKAYSMVTTVEKYIEADLNVTDLSPAKRAKIDPDVTATPSAKRVKIDPDVTATPPAKRVKIDPDVTATPPAKRVKIDPDVTATPPANLAKYDSRYCCPVEWKTNFIDHSLNHLIKVWKRFSSQYLMPDTPPTALLTGNHLHKSGSLVTWLIPSGLIPSLIKRAQTDSDFFQQHRILRMTVDGKCVYEATMEIDLTKQKNQTSKTLLEHEERAEHLVQPKVAVQETFGGCDFDPPKVTQHPKSQSALTGEQVTFKVEATGDDLTFQWLKNGSDVHNDSNYSGTDTSTLMIQHVKKSDGGCYSCLVKNEVTNDGEVSEKAQLIVSSLGNSTHAEANMEEGSRSPSIKGRLAKFNTPQVPDQPDKPNCEVVHNAVDLDWSKPDSGSQGIDWYTISYRKMDDPSAQWKTLKIQGHKEGGRVTGLAPKTLYCFKVRAENKAGVSSYSEISDPILTSQPPVSVPGQPGKPTVSKATHNTIHLEWSPPESGSDGVKFYTVSYRRMDEPSARWETVKTQHLQEAATVSGLVPKASYCFKVCADTEESFHPAESEMSDPVFTSLPPVPIKPMVIHTMAPGRPGKPTASKATHNTIHLKWPPPESGSENIKFYTVSYRRMDDPLAQWQTVKTQDSQEVAIVSGLTPKASYCFKVCAESEAGVSQESEMSEPAFTSPSSVPGRPGKPVISEVTHNMVYLEWSAPESGSDGIKFYIVSYRQMGNPSAQWETVETQDSQHFTKVSGLAAKSSYCFKVRAESEAGVSQDSEMSEPAFTSAHVQPTKLTASVPQNVVPGRPGKPKTTKVTHDTIHLNWSPPESGSDGINSYTVSYRRMDDPSAQWQIVRTRHSEEVATVSGLIPKALYFFKVCAESEAGISQESEMSEPVYTRPPPVPGQPGKPTTTEVTHDTIHLKWPSPESGSDGINSYTVSYRRMDDPSAQWQIVRTQDSEEVVTVSGLIPKALYFFKVCAESESGVSQESEMSEPVYTRPPPVPGRPGKPTTTKVTHDAIHLNWLAPESGTESINFYRVFYCPKDQPQNTWMTTETDSTNATLVVHGLSAKTSYLFKVQAVCKNGVSPASEVSDAIKTKHLPVPGKPSKPTAREVAHNKIRIIWNSPDNGAKNVKFYTVSYCQIDNPQAHWKKKKTAGPQQSLLIDKLFSNTKYCFKVTAQSETGTSLESEESDPVQTYPEPPPGQPGKPTKTKATYDTIELTWSRPKTGAKKVKCYTVSYYEVNDSAQQWMSQKTEGPREKVTIYGLMPITVYVFKVCAESDAGPSEESTCSDPYRTQPPPVPSQPGKPTASKSEVTDDSIKIHWTAPKKNSDAVKGYTVFYCKKDSPPDGWHKTGPSESPQPCLELRGLSAKTEYYFKVQAVGVYGENSQESEVGGPIETKRKERLAELMLPKSTRIENGPPSVHKLSIQHVSSDPENMIYKYCIGEASSIQGVEEKVIMVLGATGAGKSTLINGMVNYILGVEWEDQFRFKLIADEGQGSQAESQTKSITAYTFHRQKGSPFPYKLTIIDTPGFGDTGGLARDKYIISQIKEFFSASSNRIDHLNAIGFVTQSSLPRLTPTQRYIFDSILGVFGKDIASNIFMMVTFCDGGDPPVMAAVKAAQIPHCTSFKFNNSALFSNPNDQFSKMFWIMGFQSFQNFFCELQQVESRSLFLTREVLDERAHLEAILISLVPQINVVMTKMDKLEQEEQTLKALQGEISELERKKTIEVRTTQMKRIDLPVGEFVTNCLKCNRTCHYPCKIAKDEDKWRCAAMIWREAHKESTCKICTAQCRWQDHYNNQYRLEDEEVVTIETVDEVLERYNVASNDKSARAKAVDGIKNELDQLERKIIDMICKAQQIMKRLDEIALKSSPLTEVDYIDMLIETETQEGKPGWNKRVHHLKKARENAMLILQIKGGKAVPKDTPEWLKTAVEKAENEQIERQRAFKELQANPSRSRPKPAKSGWGISLPSIPSPWRRSK